jgi:hypothetical protein
VPQRLERRFDRGDEPVRGLFGSFGGEIGPDFGEVSLGRIR